jgi:hypothetical protein
MIFDFDGLHDESRQDWIEVVCDENDPSAGSVSVCLRELPDKEYQRLLLLYRAGGRSAMQTTQLMNKEASALESIEQVAQYASTFLDVSEKFNAAQAELISKMVVDHSPASFVVEFPAHASETQITKYLSDLGGSPEEIAEALQSRRAELSFQAMTWIYKAKTGEQSMKGAGPKTMKLYCKEDAFFSSLFNACKAFQTLTSETPQEVWARAAKEREQRAKTVTLDLDEKLSGENGALMAALALLLTSKQQEILQRGGRLILQFPVTETSPLA